MAREPSITQDQVSRTAEAIRDSGNRPTARSIRERLGTGSMATVLRLFNAWQESQVRPAESPVALPVSLQKGLLDFVAAEVERNKAELYVELGTLKQANADLIIESERQALIADNLTMSLETAHGDKATLAGQLREIELDRDAARKEAAAERQAAENARTELAKAQLRLEAMPRLEKEIDTLRGEVDTQRTALTVAEKSAAVAAAKLEAAHQVKAALDGALVRAAKELHDAREELKAAHASTAKAQADLLAAVRQQGPKPPTVKQAPRKSLKPQTKKE
jgi:chromosome segregation ATPase